MSDMIYGIHAVQALLERAPERISMRKATVPCIWALSLV